MWHFVMAEKAVSELAQTAVEFPPIEEPASFSLENVKRQVQQILKSHEGK